MTTDNPYANSSYARAARERKAIGIETVLRLSGCDSVTAQKLDAAGRRAAEKAAGVRPASEETWQLVFTLMRSAEHRDLIPPPQPEDTAPRDTKENDEPRPAEPRRPAPGHFT